MLKLRPYKKCDAKEVVSWVTDERTLNQWSAGFLGTYPLTEERLNAFYEERAYDSKFFVMTALDDKEVVGHLFMKFMNEELTVVRLGFVIVDSNERGKGYGKRILNLAIQYAFELLKVEKITLGVFENNTNAHHCYESIGFVENEEANHFMQIGDEQWKGIEMELTRKERKL